VNVPNNKFKPLKFIGEKTQPVTIIEDLSFSENIENISPVHDERLWGSHL
jgi:hypothetical protein